MQPMLQRARGVLRPAVLGWAMFFAADIAFADPPSPPLSKGGLGGVAGTVSQDDLWQRTIDLVARGDFKDATETIKQVHGGGRLVEQVRQWLEEYEAKQAARREMDRADFEKYVGYAKARIERKEYTNALGWALFAFDCKEEGDAFLQSDWLQDLVNDSLIAASELSQDGDWRGAWQIYSQLSTLYEREPRYEKLGHEAVTHLRLDIMFKEDSHWEERIEKVRWKDAKRALENIERFYVEPVDFRKTAESALDQLLLLADSKTAREEFEGLGNQDDRNDFKGRIQERLDQVRAAPTLDRRRCVEHFRRVIEINEQTIQLPQELLVSELMRGALEPLDDFTAIIWPKDKEEFEKHTRGDFVGVGISIVKNRADEVEVVTPLDDTPAYRAGIQAGDIIAKVDGKSLKGYSLNKVVDTITGPKDTQVTLTIRRNGKEIEFPLTRAKVKICSVKGVRRDPMDEERWDHWLDRELGIGYIRVRNFQKNTVEDVENVLSELSAGGLNGLVLDLRTNPGGLLDSAWRLSSVFLKRGDTVVSTKGRIKTENQELEALGDGAYSDVPLVVLVDERSASASEIVSGAARDNDRATVVGERTFGKFSVQNLVPLGRSSGAKLKITTARYYLPDGDSLHRDPTAERWGVEPDIPVRLAIKEYVKLRQLWREADLLGPPKAPAEEESAGDAPDESAESEPAKSGGEAEGEGDTKEQAPAEALELEESGADVEGPEEGKLPPLKQPDENDRPKEDPQLDTALLVMRVMLVGESSPTLATAEMKKGIDPIQP